MVRVRIKSDCIEGTESSVVRVRVEDDDFVINELEIRTQRVSKFLFQGFLGKCRYFYRFSFHLDFNW
jgi:hypothetical protein